MMPSYFPRSCSLVQVLYMPLMACRCWSCGSWAAACRGRSTDSIPPRFLSILEIVENKYINDLRADKQNTSFYVDKLYVSNVVRI